MLFAPLLKKAHRSITNVNDRLHAKVMRFGVTTGLIDTSSEHDDDLYGLIDGRPTTFNEMNEDLSRQIAELRQQER